MLVVSFGLRDADCNPGVGKIGSTSKDDSESIITCCRVAMKLSLLAEKFKGEMLQYETKRQKKDNLGSLTSSGSTYLRTHIGVHSCVVPVSSLPRKPEWQQSDKDSDDASLSSDEEARSFKGISHGQCQRDEGFYRLQSR